MLNWKCLGAKDFVACLGVCCCPRFLAEALSRGVVLARLADFWTGVLAGAILALGAGSRDMLFDLIDAWRWLCCREEERRGTRGSCTFLTELLLSEGWAENLVPGMGGRAARESSGCCTLPHLKIIFEESINEFQIIWVTYDPELFT